MVFAGPLFLAEKKNKKKTPLLIQGEKKFCKNKKNSGG